jgi:hypothetical protein
MSHPVDTLRPVSGNGAGSTDKLGGGMETFFGALGAMVALYVMLRVERTGLETKLTRLETNLREEISGVRGEISGLRGDVASEISGLRGDVASEISGLRGEIASVRTELGGKIDRLGEILLLHVQQGHPPHQAA